MFQGYRDVSRMRGCIFCTAFTGLGMVERYRDVKRVQDSDSDSNHTTLILILTLTLTLTLIMALIMTLIMTLIITLMMTLVMTLIMIMMQGCRDDQKVHMCLKGRGMFKGRSSHCFRSWIKD